VDSNKIKMRIDDLQHLILSEREMEPERQGRFAMLLNELHAYEFARDNIRNAIESKVRDLRQTILSMSISKMDDIFLLMKLQINYQILKEVLEVEN